jgi:dTDP-4-dehydrorhamnose 3,5-epimerase-like enzyme
MAEVFKERGETIVKGADPYIDDRGKINNYVLDEPVNWVGTITSKRGIIRANHYHPEQTQKVLVISGKYISVSKDLKVENSSLIHKLVQAGDLVITPPNVAHTMIFLEDSVIINLVTGERKHEDFGKHTIKYELVKPEEIQSYVSQYS